MPGASSSSSSPLRRSMGACRTPRSSRRIRSSASTTGTGLRPRVTEGVSTARRERDDEDITHVGHAGTLDSCRPYAATDEPFIQPAEDILHRKGHHHQAHEAGEDPLAILPDETLAELPRHQEDDETDEHRDEDGQDEDPAVGGGALHDD